MVPFNNINIPLYTVALPALSRIADEHLRFRRAFCALISHVAMITMPAAALVFVTADWLTALLFGANWSGMAPLVSGFAIAATYQPILLTVSLIYLPQNRSREMVRATAVDVGLSIASFIAGAPFGALGVALSYSLAGLVLRLPIGIWLATRQGPVRIADLWAAILPSLAAAGAVVIVVNAARTAIVPELLQVPFTNLLGAFVAALATALLTFLAIRPSRRILATGLDALSRIQARA
jgi:PST family polysaccharide transporter